MDATLVLECARANGDIVSSRKGILDLRITVSGRAAHAGRRAREGSERDPRGGPDRRRPARPQRTVAGRHRQRRRDLRRHAAQRRGRALLARGGRAGRHPGRARGGRGRDPAGRGRHRRARHDRRVRTDGALVADGATAAQRPPGRPREGRRRGPRVHDQRQRDRRRVGRQHDVGHGHPEPRRPGAGRRQRPLTDRVHRGRVDRAADRACWPGCCSPSDAIRWCSRGATRHRTPARA